MSLDLINPPPDRSFVMHPQWLSGMNVNPDDFGKLWGEIPNCICISCKKRGVETLCLSKHKPHSNRDLISLTDIATSYIKS